MSLHTETPRASSALWKGTLIIGAGLAVFALAMPLLTGLHTQLPGTLQPLVQKIGFQQAVADSLAGRAVIIDLRPAKAREQIPVPGSAILVPDESESPDWDALAPLLESLWGTPVYLIFPRSGDHPAHFKLMPYQLDLWFVEMTP